MTTTRNTNTSTAGASRVTTTTFSPEAGKPAIGEVAPGLRQGASGPQVSSLQSALERYGFPAHHTGTFDATTAKQVRAFQEEHGLPRTGVLDVNTRDALASAEPRGEVEALYTHDHDAGPPSTMTTTTSTRLPGGMTETKSVMTPIRPTGPSIEDVSVGKKRGDVGPEVFAIQQRLQSWGFDAPGNSQLDARTEKALRAFQREAGLPESGVADEATLSVLRREPGAALAEAHSLAGARSQALAASADAEAKANVAAKTAAGEKIDGYCAKHVNLALQHAGFAPGGGDAHTYGEQLRQRADVTEIVGLTRAELEELPPGAIIVYGKSEAHEHGHVTVVSNETSATGERLESSDHQQDLDRVAFSRTYGNSFGNDPGGPRFRVFIPIETQPADLPEPPQ
jgi:peptidoglycan hydrolase-like protein with peptidoglycan-binding domain